MRLSNIALAITAIYGAFSPADLFANGEQGAWYDPSDYSTLFTDSAGTTPVTGVEQFVGLMLDKSQGLVLGSELVTNGDFSSGGTGWTAGAAGVTFTGGEAVYVSVTSTFTVRQSGVITAEKTYEVQFEITAYTSGTIQAKLNGTVSALGLSRSAAGIYREYITSTSTADGILAFQVSGFTGSIDNISVRELPGNHAFQTSSTKRPKLAARYNLLTYSEEFDNGVWSPTTRITVTPNDATSPVNTLTADRVTETIDNGTHRVTQTVTLAAGASYTGTVYWKKGTRRWVWISINSASNNATQFFDLDDVDLGTATQSGTEVVKTAASIVDAGNGWRRCSLTVSVASIAGAESIFTGLAPTDGTNSYVGSTSDYNWVWGADLRPASQATGLIGPTYQRVAAATVYDTAGFLPYLAFDGLDDSMSTNSIDFSAGDKMTVWAGVRKLSDAAQAVVAELSADINTNNGTFRLQAPNAASPTYGWVSKGTTRRDATPSGYAAPITNVLAAIGDISGDAATLRVNGTQAATNTNDQGTGNYGNYPMFIGARNNASSFLPGWLTSLIIRGAQSTQSQIEATEAWVAGKTGVSI